MIVNWHLSRISTLDEPYSYERAVINLLNMAGLSRVRAQARFAHPSYVSSEWYAPLLVPTSITNTTYGSFPAYQIVNTSTAGPAFVLHRATRGVSSFIITARLSHGALLSFNPSPGEYVSIGLNWSGHAVMINNANSFVTTQSPYIYPPYSYATILVRTSSFGEAGSEPTQVYAMWLNGNLALTHTFYSATPFNNIPIGFGAHRSESSNTTAVVADMRLGWMQNILDMYTVDPGETPASALSRITQGINYRIRCTHNETIVLDEPPIYQAPSFTISDSMVIGEATIVYDRRPLNTYLRIMAGTGEVEYINHTLAGQYGLRFAQDQNPYILNLNDAYEFAQRSVLLAYQKTETISLTIPAYLVAEPGDVFTYQGKQYLIETIEYQMTPASLTMKITGRWMPELPIYNVSLYDVAVYDT